MDKICAGKQCNFSPSKLISWLSVIAVAFLVLTAISNWQPVEMHLFSAVNGWIMPLGLLVLLSLGAGFVAGISDYLSVHRTAKHEQIKDQWQAQDAKLVASLTSDREKQLEAKIATLETALDKALKNKS